MCVGKKGSVSPIVAKIVGKTSCPLSFPRGLQSPKTFVIPAQAGIQTEDFDPVSLDPRFRGGDEKNDFAIHRGKLCLDTDKISK